jgi:GNAT superfamily N-acetyltransferase
MPATDRPSAVLSVQRFAPANRRAFFDLHHTDHDAGWCFCVAWWVNTWEGWGERSAAENQAFREALLEQGNYDGYLLFLGERPIGWCQVGERDRLSKLARSYRLPPDPNAWAISCFFIAPDQRRAGRAAFLLHSVIADLRQRGIRRLEAFPRTGLSLAPHQMWTGPQPLFLAEGFQLEVNDTARPVLALRLD